MNINYSINNSVLMMMSEFMITAFVIVILFVIVLVYNKAFKSELSIKIFCFSQLTAIFISVLEITTKRTNAGSISITWSDGIHQFYTHVFLGFAFSFLLFLLGLYDYKMKGNKDGLKDCKKHVLPCFIGSWFVLIIFFFSASPLRYEENLITDARVVASDPNRTTIIYADGFYWLFDMDRNEFDKSISREIVRGNYKMLCTSDTPATCWAGRKFPKNTSLDKVF